MAAIKGSALSAKKGIAVLGGALAALSAGGIAKSVQAASRFESAMVEVEKVTSRDIASNLNSQLVELSRTIPLTANELAGLAADAGRFGIEGEKNILAFTETVAKMATATDLSAEQAGEAFAKLATMTNTPIPQIGNLGSAINALSNNAATSSSEIIDNMMRSSTALSNLGASNTEIVALAGALNEVSPNASYAGTQLARLAEQMVDPRKVQDLSRALGMNVKQYKAQVKNDPTGMILQMAEAMRGGGKAADILNTTLTATSRKALRGLGKNLKGTKDALKLTAGEFEKNTSLQKEFDAAIRTAKSQLQLLRNELMAAAITTGQQFLPAVAGVLLVVKEAVGAFNDFNSATDGMAGVIILVTGLISGLAAMFAGLGAMIPAGAIAAAGGAFLAVVGPVAALTAAVGALVVAFQQDFAGIRTATMNVVSVLRDEFLPIFTMLKSTVGIIISDLAAAFTSNSAEMEGSIRLLVGAIANDLINGIRSAAQIAFELLAQLGTWWNNHKDTVIQAIRSIVSGVQRGFNLVGTIIRDVASAFKGSGVDIQTVVSQIGSVIGSVLITTLQTLGQITNQVVTAMAQWWRANGDTVVSVIRTIISAVGSFINALVQISGPVIRLANALGSVLMPVLQGVWEGFKLVWAPIVDLLMPAFRMISNFITSTVSPAIISLGPHIDRLAVSIEQWAARNQGLLTSIGKVIGVIIGLLAPIGQLIGVLGRVIGFIARLIPGFMRLIGVVTRTGGVLRTVITAFVQFGARAVSAVVSGVTRSWQALTRFIGIAIRTGQTVQRLVTSFVQFGIRAAQAIVRGFTRIRSIVTSAMGQIRTVIVGGWTRIRGVVTGAVNRLRAIITGAFNRIRAVITTATNRQGSVIRAGWNRIRSVVTGVVSRLRSIVTSGWNQMRSTITSGMNRIRSVITSTWNRIRSTIQATTNRVRGIIRTAWNAIRSRIGRAMNRIRNVIQGEWNRIRSLTQSTTNRIRSVIQSAFNRIRSVIQSATNRIRSIIQSAWNRIRSITQSTINRIRSAVQSGWNRIRRITQGLMNRLRRVISSGMNRARGVVKSGMNRLVSTVKSTASRFLNAGKGLMKALARGIKGAAGRATGAVSDVVSDIRKKLPGSDADEGPLSDITKAGAALPATLARGILGNESALTRASERIAAALKEPIQKLVDDFESIFDQLGSIIKDAFSNIAQRVSQSTLSPSVNADTDEGVKRYLRGLNMDQRFTNAELTQLMPTGYLDESARMFDEWLKSGRGAKATRKRLQEAGYTIDRFRKKLTQAGDIQSMSRRRIAEIWESWTGIEDAADMAMRSLKTISEAPGGRGNLTQGMPSSLVEDMRAIHSRILRGKMPWEEYVGIVRDYGAASGGTWFEDAAYARLDEHGFTESAAIKAMRAAREQRQAQPQDNSTNINRIEVTVNESDTPNQTADRVVDRVVSRVPSHF